MKIRRSARTILATLLVLTVFTSLTAWHNQTSQQLSDLEKQDLIKQLNLKNPKLLHFIKAMPSGIKTQSFYVMGTNQQNTWPVNLTRACYADPLAAWSMTDKGQTPRSDKHQLIRYRSVEDFLITLNQAEVKTPGTLRALTFSQYQALPEPPLAISFRLLISLIVGVSGLLLLRFINR